MLREYVATRKCRRNHSYRNTLPACRPTGSSFCCPVVAKVLPSFVDRERQTVGFDGKIWSVSEFVRTTLAGSMTFVI